MKRTKISPLKTNQNDKVLLGDELNDPEKIEWICSQCNCGPLVTITDKAGNTDRFCRRCSAVYSMDDNTVRRKYRLSVPEETEPSVSIINYDYDKDVEIRHAKELRGGIAELQKRGLKITDYRTTEKQ